MYSEMSPDSTSTPTTPRPPPELSDRDSQPLETAHGWLIVCTLSKDSLAQQGEKRTREERGTREDVGLILSLCHLKIFYNIDWKNIISIKIIRFYTNT